MEGSDLEVDVTEILEDDVLSTEPEEGEGRYDGCPQDADPDVEEAAKNAATEYFYEDAVRVAKEFLLKTPGLLKRWEFEDAEEAALNEAAKELFGLNRKIWDEEAEAEHDAELARQEAERKRQAEEAAQRKAEAFGEAERRLRAGQSHYEVHTWFKNLYPWETIHHLVGSLRAQGINIVAGFPAQQPREAK
jgi:hypothetical protein